VTTNCRPQPRPFFCSRAALGSPVPVRHVKFLQKLFEWSRPDLTGYRKWFRQSRRGFSCAFLSAIAMQLTSVPCNAEISVDWLYDFRHATDARDNGNNFPVVELKLFVPQSFGTFLVKEEMDLDAPNHNVSQVYTELTQSIKLGHITFRDLPLFAHIGYSGGLGLFGDAAGGFYIRSAYNIGLEYRFDVQKAFCDVSAALRYSNLSQRSYDPMLTIYAGRYFLNYKLLIANSLEAWTSPNEQSGAANHSRTGKFTSWELESEAWYKVAQRLSVGTYVRTTRNVYGVSNRWLVYPSIGVRYAF
jgi:hypothetical protein